MRPPAACWRWSSTARASATPSSRPAGPTTARGSSTRRTMSPRSCATARTCSARSSAPAGTPASSASNPLRRGNHYGEDPALLCELHIEHDDGSVEVIASDERWRATTGPIEYSDLLMGERYDARRELGSWTPVAPSPRATTSLLVPERSQPMRVTEELRPVAITEPRSGRARLRPRPEHGRPRAPRRGGRAWHARSGCASPRCSSRTARSTWRTCAPRGSEDVYVLRGGGAEVLRAALHLPRLPLRRGDRPRRQARPADDHRPRRALRHAAQRLVRMLGRARQPALAQHQLGPARQLHLGPDRLPAARRAARLARRCPGLRPHRDAEHGRRRLLHQVGRRRARRAVARGRVPRRRAAAGARARRRARVGRRRRDRAVDRLAPLRRSPPRRAPLGRDGALPGLPPAPQPGPAVDRHGAATTTATGSRSARRRRATSSRRRTGPTTPS